MVSLLNLNVTGNPLSQCTYLPAGVISPDGNFKPASMSNACTNVTLFTTKGTRLLIFLRENRMLEFSVQSVSLMNLIVLGNEGIFFPSPSPPSPLPSQ